MQNVAGVLALAQVLSVAEVQRCVGLSVGLLGWSTKLLYEGLGIFLEDNLSKVQRVHDMLYLVTIPPTSEGSDDSGNTSGGRICELKWEDLLGKRRLWAQHIILAADTWHNITPKETETFLFTSKAYSWQQWILLGSGVLVVVGGCVVFGDSRVQREWWSSRRGAWQMEMAAPLGQWHAAKVKLCIWEASR